LLDYAALAGILAAVVYCALHWRRLMHEPDGAIAFAFIALAAVAFDSELWWHAYAFGRFCSPLLLVVGLDGFRSRSTAAALPAALSAPRIGLEMGLQAVGILRGLLGL